MLEQIAQDRTSGLLVRINADILRPAIGPAYRVLGEQAADLVWLVMAGTADVLPDLFLAVVIGRDGKRHELLEGHAIFGIDLVQLRRHRRQTQALLDDCW